MRALTICQPYAHLIVSGRKTIEYRSWYCGFRGPLLIHAGLSRSWLEPGDERRNPGMVFGAIVGRADVITWSRDGPGEQWEIVLRNIERLATPIRWRGQQRLFNVPDAALAGVVWKRSRAWRCALIAKKEKCNA